MPVLKIRRGSSDDWSIRNPVLANGEPGFEADTGKFKIGDGVRKWTALDYFIPGAGSPGVDEAMLLAHIESETPHPTYDDGPSLLLLYENAKV